MTHIEEAVATCKYALSFGLTALNEHFDIWLDGIPADNPDERAYQDALTEVKTKLGTSECLLK